MSTGMPRVHSARYVPRRSARKRSPSPFIVNRSWDAWWLTMATLAFGTRSGRCSARPSIWAIASDTASRRAVGRPSRAARL